MNADLNDWVKAKEVMAEVLGLRMTAPRFKLHMVDGGIKPTRPVHTYHVSNGCVCVWNLCMSSQTMVKISHLLWHGHIHLTLQIHAVIYIMFN